MSYSTIDLFGYHVWKSRSRLKDQNV